MAHRKAGGTAKNLRDSQPKYLGIKLSDGQLAKPGAIIVRQRGTEYWPGNNVGLGRDHTLFALTGGMVKFRTRRRRAFNAKLKLVKEVSILTETSEDFDSNRTV